MADEILEHYQDGREETRLAAGVGLLERERLLGMLRRLAAEPALRGASAHLLAIARKER